MFGKKEYRAARKGKILGFTASNGRQLFILCPSPWNSEAFARLVKRRVGPFSVCASQTGRVFAFCWTASPCSTRVSLVRRSLSSGFRPWPRGPNIRPT